MIEKILLGILVVITIMFEAIIVILAITGKITWQVANMASIEVILIAFWTGTLTVVAGSLCRWLYARKR